MKQYLWTIVVVTLVLPIMAIGQEFEPEGPGEMERAEHEMAMRARQMELEQHEQMQDREAVAHEAEMYERKLELKAREGQMDLKRKMGELELEKKKIELEHMRRANMDGPDVKQAQMRRLEQQKRQPGRAGIPKPRGKDAHPILLLIAAVHILTAVWVYQDIRKKNAGSGLWIVIALLTGLLGTLVYAVVRLGDIKEK